ncbi:MAG TPA: hypothetical protein VFI25_15820 [Planctomycetota bacterium]|jgi:hypothetical protein|nr:hypothetical protein [Planctomycetota bacterium]
MRLQSIAFAAAAAALLTTSALAQMCAIPCNGTQVVCHHQNGIRNHRGVPTAPWVGPNTLTIGNFPGDAEWKIWAVENGMTRGSGVSTVTNWEIGAVSPAPGTQSFNIPDMELRPVVIVGGLKEPDMTAVAIDNEIVGNIALPMGSFRINVSIRGPTVAAPPLCGVAAGLPTLSNADVAMLFLYTPGTFPPPMNSYSNLVTTTEANTVSNPSVPPSGTGNSYSGTYNGLLGVVTHYPINQELFAELGFYEPTLEVHRQTTGFTAPTRGSGARELAAGDTVVLVLEDWQAGIDAMNGQDRLTSILISDASAGSPVGQAPPGGGPGFFPGAALLPGSAGFAPIYVTPVLAQTLVPFSGTVGQGFNCHVVGDVSCTASGIPSVFTDLQASTPVILVPPGLTGLTLYVAAFDVNLTTLTIPEGTNLVELAFL